MLCLYVPHYRHTYARAHWQHWKTITTANTFIRKWHWFYYDPQYLKDELIQVDPAVKAVVMFLGNPLILLSRGNYSLCHPRFRLNSLRGFPCVVFLHIHVWWTLLQGLTGFFFKLGDSRVVKRFRYSRLFQVSDLFDNTITLKT